MSNADSPAYPVAEDHKVADEFAWTAGLTKREHFAAMAMQGLLSNPALVDTMNESIDRWVSVQATAQADALLSRLEEAQS